MAAFDLDQNIKDYGIHDTHFTHKQLEAGVSLGKIRLIDDKHSYQELKTILTTTLVSIDGLWYEEEKDDRNRNYPRERHQDKCLEKYINPAFWHVLKKSTKLSLVITLLRELIDDLVLKQSFTTTVKINIGNRLPYLIITRPELVIAQLLFNTFKKTNDDNFQSASAGMLLNIFIIAHVEIHANEVIDNVIDLYKDEIYIVSNMKAYGETNKSVLKTSYKYLLRSYICNHNDMVFIQLEEDEIDEEDAESDAIKYTDATNDQRCLARKQLYSALRVSINKGDE